MALEILPIDLSSTVIGSAVSFIVVIISYLIYKIGIGEKSFEEVIEEQKRQSMEEELKQKSEKVKKEKKFKKTWTKKSKDKSESEVSIDSAQDVDSKDVETNIEIIEPKSVKQKYKSKSAALNTQSSDIITQEKVKVDTSVNEKSISSKKKMLEESSNVEDSKQVKSVEISKQENVQPLPSAPVHTASQPLIVSQKKKKKESVEKNTIPLTSMKLITMIRESDLEAEEIQKLIDVLLNKQKDTSGWTKINDPLALTKKNLHEKEQLLDRELQQNQDMTSKLKDLREECNALKSKVTVQEKSSVDRIARLQHDVQNLTTRTKQLQDQLAAEKEKLAQIDKENEKKIAASVKALEQEKAQLLQKISKLEAESRSGILKTEYETAKKAREDLQKVHMLLVEQHTLLVSKEKNQQAQLTDLKAQIEKLNAQNKSLFNENSTLQNTVASLELAKKSVEDKLLAKKEHSGELEIQEKQLSSQTENKLLSELKELKLENERLAEQVAATRERYVGNGQEILHQNGELNGKTQEISEKLSEKNKLLEEKEFLLTQLNDDLSKQKAKFTLLSEEIESQKQKNNELREKNWKAMEALTIAEQKMKEMQLNADKRTEQFENHISSHAVQKECIMCPDITDKLKKAEADAAQNLLHYNSEMEKNRLLSSEIDKLNQHHKSQIDKMQIEIVELKACIEKCQSKTKECLQRIYPSVSISSSLAYENWLVEFEQQVVIAIKNTTAEKEHELIQKQKHYEQALAETESTLLDLQKTAESQEILWQERLKSKEFELEKVKSEIEALLAEKEAMASAFQKISQLEELQEKLKLLQNNFENAESERLNFELKYDEVQKNCLNLKDQLENKEKQILELQRESGSLENLNKEIEDLKSKLEKEKKISKDFSSQMIRLNSLVKIGQDALKTEQEMVKKLKAQIEATQVSATNGTSSSTISSPVSVNQSQTKAKNSAKSKKKMDASDK